MEQIQKIIDDMLASGLPNVIAYTERLNVALDDIAEELVVLRAARRALEEALQSEQKANGELIQLIQKLRNRIKYLERKVFGSSSEKSKPNDKTNPQPDASSGEMPSDDDLPNEDDKPEGKGKGQKPFGENAKRKKKVIPPPSLACACGGETYCVGRDIIERVAYKPAEINIIEEHYEKHKCKCCGTFTQAKVPPQIFEGSYVTNSLLAGLIVGKYADFLPLYRQAEILKRSGVYFERSTLTRWTNKTLLEALKPVVELMKQELLSSSFLQMDETTAPTLKAGNGKVKMAYALALLRDQRRCSGNEFPCVVFEYAPSRAGLHIEGMLDGFDGVLQVDGYSGYGRLTKDTREGGDPILLAYCWAHVRRKFEQQWKSNNCALSKQILDLIAKMYKIEADLKGQSPMVRRQTRQLEIEPILHQIRAILIDASHKSIAKDGLGNAIVYTLKLWDGLILFVNDGCVEIDNNNVENAIRKWVMCRKNSLFAGSEAGGEAWAIAASIIGTCALMKINPHEYLEWVLDQIAAKHPRSEYWKLLPWEYLKWLATKK